MSDEALRGWRRGLLVGLCGFTALAAFAGAVQLALGVATPPVRDLAVLGLASWRLPALWLFASVAVPMAIASVAVARSHPHARVLARVAAGLLVVELLVQIPFVGPSALQAVMGSIAVAIAWASHARRG